MYKQRFENIFRVALKITSSLNIGDILEMIREEAKQTVPSLQEICLLMIDPEASNYTRPLHCSLGTEKINCQLCKRGRSTVATALEQSARSLCFLHDGDRNRPIPVEISAGELNEIVLPIYEGDKPLAVMDAIAQEGKTLGETDLILLTDLVDLCTNIIINGRTHWKMSQEKLSVDRILGHLRPFVPATVQKIVEKNPDAPSFQKRDEDVSILFLDVAGYTRISETLTQEMVNFVIEKYFSSFLDVLHNHGGDINETAGDGLMVIFQGDPSEHAVNAAKAALTIRGRTIEINKELQNRFQPINVNMGINSGITSLGMSRFQGTTGTRMTFTASGSVTNLAARIASASKNGDILVGPETAKRITAVVPTYDRGLMNFKNVSESVQVASLVRME